jgi:hypothetical protein
MDITKLNCFQCNRSYLGKRNLVCAWHKKEVNGDDYCNNHRSKKEYTYVCRCGNATNVINAFAELDGVDYCPDCLQLLICQEKAFKCPECKEVTLTVDGFHNSEQGVTYCLSCCEECDPKQDKIDAELAKHGM